MFRHTQSGGSAGLPIFSLPSLSSLTEDLHTPAQSSSWSMLPLRLVPEGEIEAQVRHVLQGPVLPSGDGGQMLPCAAATAAEDQGTAAIGTPEVGQSVVPLRPGDERALERRQIGRASCRERV